MVGDSKNIVNCVIRKNDVAQDIRHIIDKTNMVAHSFKKFHFTHNL